VVGDERFVGFEFQSRSAEDYAKGLSERPRCHPQRSADKARLTLLLGCGGIATLRALAGPFPLMRFCPTGGIDQHWAADYLTL
jgi:hypothetical protein